LDYLQEPDIFHDVFGHVPMLTDPVFADYMQAYGQAAGGRWAGSPGQSGAALLVHRRVRPDEHRAGPADLRRGDRLVAHRVDLRARRPLPQPHRLRPGAGDADALPDRRFPAGLFRHRLHPDPAGGHPPDFAPIYDRLENASDIGIAEILSDDTVFTRGTQAYAKTGGRLVSARG
jgi:phenylalanine-4-hydroxylase